MLAKLLKYDFRSLRRFGLPIISLFAALIGLQAEDPLVISNLTMVIGCVLLTGLHILFYYLTKYMMEKKLNLA